MSTALSEAHVSTRVAPADRHAILRELEKKVLWLASWTIHNANHLRPSADGLKVGGHQASCASLATLMTALYFDVLRPEDRVAVKPHASPIFHAIQYLLGNQSREKLASLVQDYVRARDDESGKGRMVALVGDAELDEGNVFEALLEGWKHDVRNLWWVVDYNRQSLDAVVSDRLFGRFDQLFTNMGWRVETLKYARRSCSRAAPRGASISSRTSAPAPASRGSWTTTTTACWRPS
jgi:pyruvate dehydrogenase E1 component